MVPRALTPDKLAAQAPATEEERRTVPPVQSLRSLAQDPQRVAPHVVRLPSAPLTAAGAPHTIPAGMPMQGVQVVLHHHHHHPTSVRVITTAPNNAQIGGMPAVGTTARLLG